MGCGRRGPRPAKRPVAGALAVGLSVVWLGACSSAPPTDPVERARQSKQLYQEGVNLFNAGELDGAIARLNDAARLQPTWSLLRYDLGRLLVVRAQRSSVASLQAEMRARTARQEGQAKEAERLLEESRTLHERTLADLRAAQGHLLYALDRMPWEPNVYYYLAQVHVGLGEFARAKSYLEEAIDKAGQHGAMSHNLEQALRRLEQYAQAQERGLRP
ncbi:MAG: hypothetical protein KatS3mg102_2498 [Planctomycetota bacterium]|nr:MAG: hypothetical protein KatS3mg102_2498 [Planctomycetota bacterium]